MKKIIILLTVLLTVSNYASAKARIPVCFPCEYIELVEDLPEDTDYRSQFDEPLNVGYKYEQINILWIPIWNYEGEYCFVNNEEDTYYDLTSMEKKQLMGAGVEFPDNPIGAWDKYGGKVIILIILGLVVMGMRSKDDEEPEANKPTTVNQ